MLIFGRWKVLQGGGRAPDGLSSSARWTPHEAGTTVPARSDDAQREIDQACHSAGINGRCGPSCPAFGLQVGACDEAAR